MLSVVVLIAGFSHLEAASEPAAGPRPRFVEAACDLPGIPPQLRPRLRCGTVSVPRDYTNPSSGSYKLALVAIQSLRHPSLPDPVVYISGGPGGPLTIFAGHQAAAPYAPQRDLILVDQRGTGRSEPSLCPDRNNELLDADIAVLGQHSKDALAKRRAAYAACRGEAVAHGIDVRDFGTRVTAEDYEWVRRALGIDRWNVYGESYGTTVAMTLVALHPQHVRSVVLDSVYPPDPVPARSTLATAARDAFFAYCAHDERCAATVSDLAGTYRQTLDQLTSAPLAVTVPPEMHQTGNRVLLTASLFQALINNLIYYPTYYPRLPRLIAAVHDGNSEALAAILGSVLAAFQQLNWALNVAVECRDRPHLHEPLPAGAQILGSAPLNDICESWSDVGPAPLVPTGSSVPTLVLAGEFDPVAGPTLSHHVARLIGDNARWIEFPRVGHNVRAFSACGARIASDFIDNPTRPIDASCVSEAAPIRFLPRAQTH